MNLLAQMTWGQWFLAAVIIGVCLLLMLVILLQKGRGGGLAGAFGGGGGSSAFGAKTGDVFTWITVAMAGVFLLLAIGANFVFDQSAIAQGDIPMEATGTPLDVPLELPAGGVRPGLTKFQVGPDGKLQGLPEGIELITTPVLGTESGAADDTATPGDAGADGTTAGSTDDGATDPAAESTDDAENVKPVEPPADGSDDQPSDTRSGDSDGETGGQKDDDGNSGSDPS